MRTSLLVSYRDATSVPYGQLLIDLLPRMDHQLRYRTNTGSIPLNFYIPNRLKQSKSQKSRTMNTQILSAFRWLESFSHKSKTLFLQSCPKEFIRFLCECRVNLLKGNLQSIKRHRLKKFQIKVQWIYLKKMIWKQRCDVLAS